MYHNIREEELKIKVGQEYFSAFDCSKMLGNVDFCVSSATEKGQTILFEQQSLLWAEAKKGSSDIYKSIVQLILTIGKARTFDKFLPPSFLGAFDAEKIAFIPYSEIHSVFYQNDFNWNVAPSNHETKEFKQVHETVKNTIENKALLFYFGTDDIDIQEFIKINFIEGKTAATKIKVDKNNFMIIYNKWLVAVKPTIVVNWENVQKKSIIDADFYLADLLSLENKTLKEQLYVLLKTDHYELDRILDEDGFFITKTVFFKDKQKAHTQFWNRYERPPKEEYWDYIVNRRDLLVPQDIRERKGSFYTPQIWVELSQKYLADTLGENWQDEYYIWDCAAGTGNLLAGLTNTYHIFASTLDRQDIDVMKDRIANGANLAENHVFQFDFLNDDFTKLPPKLQEIINDEEKRKKLLIYINPPYAEAPQRIFEKQGKIAVEQSKTNQRYSQVLGQGNRELFVQFLTRIYFEIPDCKIAQFSKLKIINSQHFVDFRKFYKAELKKGFVCPATSFDNVKGVFPIGFMIWDTSQKVLFRESIFDVYRHNGAFIGRKHYYSYDNSQYINDWIKPFRADVAKNQLIGKFPFMGNDFQQQSIIQISHHKMTYNKAAGQFYINQKNVKYACIYFAVRKCIAATWLNDRDQFLYPNDGWEKDTEFHDDCLAYTLFNNNIQSQYGTNHWIPFTELEVKPRGKFESNFMSQYIAGKVDTEITFDLFGKVEKEKQKPIVFSAEAKNLFEIGKKLWQYYHKQPNSNPDAALYDIREYFQGRSEKGKMNNGSEDETYTKLIGNLREKLKTLGDKIAPKVYEYGFLKA